VEKMIVRYIEEFIRDCTMKTRYRSPLAGFSSAQDPLFYQIRDMIPNHALPKDLLPRAASVVSYFVPFGREVPGSNIKSKQSSPLWVRAYMETNRIIEALNLSLGKELLAHGVKGRGIAPTHDFDPIT
jgi:epoxyqueuosine reductase QueG